jgi:hypothetical protein
MNEIMLSIVMLSAVGPTLVLSANTGLGRKGLELTNTLAYFLAIRDEEKKVL